jgi:hypothetical protein
MGCSFQFKMERHPNGGASLNGWSIPRTLREQHFPGSCTYGPKARGSISSYPYHLRQFQKYSALFRTMGTIDRVQRNVTKEHLTRHKDFKLIGNYKLFPSGLISSTGVFHCDITGHRAVARLRHSRQIIRGTTIAHSTEERCYFAVRADSVFNQQ